MIVVKNRQLEKKRAEHGFTKKELADRIGVCHSVIVRAEQMKGVSPKTAKSLCDTLDSSFDELFELKGGKANDTTENADSSTTCR
jgi:DNA-binding XRE family transcriptional regulator